MYVTKRLLSSAGCQVTNKKQPSFFPYQLGMNQNTLGALEEVINPSSWRVSIKMSQRYFLYSSKLPISIIVTIACPKNIVQNDCNSSPGFCALQS
jgi:hypothetical protein